MRLRVGRQLPAVGRVVAGDVGDDGQLSAHLVQTASSTVFALLHALVDALAGGAAHIQALHALLSR
jgi:hypothetical protein